MRKTASFLPLSKLILMQKCGGNAKMDIRGKPLLKIEQMVTDAHTALVARHIQEKMIY